MKKLQECTEANTHAYLLKSWRISVLVINNCWCAKFNLVSEFRGFTGFQALLPYFRIHVCVTIMKRIPGTQTSRVSKCFCSPIHI